MIELLTWRKKKILHLTDDADKRIHISFGLKKARLLLQNIEAIREFAGSQESEPSTNEAVL